MSENLYLFEIVIKKFKFERIIEPYPKRSIIKIEIKFGDIINGDLDVSNDINDKESQEVEYNLGKSFLFSCRNLKLHKAISYTPLEITVNDLYRTIGHTRINFQDNFKSMITAILNKEEAHSAKMDDVFDILNDSNRVVGRVEIYIRLSCFGEHIETSFCIKENYPDEDYLFNCPNSTNVYQCKKITSKNCFLGRDTIAKEEKPDQDQTNLSWAALFKANLGPRISVANAEFGALISSVSAYSMMTLGDKPTVEQVKEICELITHAIMDLDKEENPDILNINEDKINENTCKERDCKAVKLYQDRGIKIRNLTKKNLFKGPNDYPVDYGMNRAYGSLNQHGPESKYRRPKRINMPFTPVP